MQHSTPEMKTKLLTMEPWATTSATQDGIALLKTIRDISHKKDGGADATTILDFVCMDKDMFLVHQAPTELLSSYLSKFKGAVDVVDSSDGYPWSCENIHSWISLVGDLAFSHQGGIYGFKFPKRFSGDPFLRSLSFTLFLN
jgi:hypothetical protein